jgi:hypothetical protein
MPSPTTPLQVITDSLNLTRAVGVDETLTSLEVSDGLRAFNDLLENWSTQKLAVYGIADQTFTFVAGTGTYTIGTGGTFNTTRPERINSPGYTTVATGVTLPCTSMTQQEYDLLPYKTQQNDYPWRFLYVNSYPLGILTFWPVPSEANTITLAIDRIAHAGGDGDDLDHLPAGLHRGVQVQPRAAAGRSLRQAVPARRARARHLDARRHQAREQGDAGHALRPGDVQPPHRKLERLLMPRIPVFGLGLSSKSPFVTAKVLQNMYAEQRPEGEKSMMVGFQTPGETLFTDFGGNPSRGGMEFESLSVAFVVNQGTLWEINNAGTQTNRGALLTTTGRVSIADNGTQIMIVDGTYGYIYNTSTNVFAQIVDVDFPAKPVTVTFLAGRFVVNLTGSSRFYVSDLYDGTSWDALNFANAETSPDPISAVLASNGQLILLGTRTTEYWGLSGSLDFAFALIARYGYRVGHRRDVEPREVRQLVRLPHQEPHGPGDGGADQRLPAEENLDRRFRRHHQRLHERRRCERL